MQIQVDETVLIRKRSQHWQRKSLRCDRLVWVQGLTSGPNSMGVKKGGEISSCCMIFTSSLRAIKYVHDQLVSQRGWMSSGAEPFDVGTAKRLAGLYER